MAISQHSFRLLFLIIFLFPSASLLLQVQAADPMAYAPQIWINNISLGSNSYPGGKFRSILLRHNHDTSNPSVACGFICTDPCSVFLFAVFFVEIGGGGGISSRANPVTVWSANQYNPVRENATVLFTADGNLALHEANGTSVWSSSGSSAVGINITEAGNLVLFARDNTTVWQSRDHPANVLFLNQDLREGQKLRLQDYYITVLDNGLYAFVDLSPPLMYCFKRDLNVTSTKGNSFVHYTNESLTLFAPSLTNKGILLTNLVSALSSFQYMSLDSDGRVRIYDWESRWLATGDLFFAENCTSPLTCGEYGLSSDKNCSCPGTKNGNKSYFEPVNASRPDLGCYPVTDLSCDSIKDHQFLNLTEVSYFGYFDIHAAALSGVDEERCVRACLRNCSCKAALFMYYENASDGYCFLPSQFLSLLANDPISSKHHSNAHIKIQTTPESSPPSHTNIGVVLGSIFGALTFLILVGVLILRFYRRRRKGTPGDVEGEEHFDEIPGMPTRFSYEQLAAATDNFAEKLGEGGFGSVFAGRLGDENVAVKLLRGVDQGRKEFLAEVQTIGKTHHFNLVRLIGFCADKSHRMLAYEYMPNGSLDRWIFNRNPGQRAALNWQMRCKIIDDIARGLSYLHEECPQKIAHLDIKPQNILLDDKFNAKVSDFGMAKLIERDKTHVMTIMRGTPGYLAPEWLTSFITEKVDVYSFGVMVLEIVCGRRNLDPSQPSFGTNLVRQLAEKIKAGRVLDLLCNDEADMAVDRDEAIQMIKLATWCLNHNPDQRPYMSTVVKVLEGVVNVETGIEENFIAGMPAMPSQLNGLGTSSSDYASSASPPQSSSLLSGAR